MSQTSAFDKILQLQEYKSQISRLIVDEIFEKLHQSAQQWIELVHSNSRKRRRHTRYSCWHRLELFGSSPVGTSTECSDVDVNLIVPPIFTAENFFEGFPKFLERNGFMDIYTVLNASVPLICFTYKKMEVDLCFTVLSHETCPTIIDLMRFPAEQYVNKKKGFLVTQGLRVAYILKECFLSNCHRDNSRGSIQSKGPSPDSSGCFYQLGSVSRRVLRYATLFIKSWAQKRGIYGNIFCYPGGVSWTIMIIYCFLVFKRINCMPIDNWSDNPSEAVLSLLTRNFLTYFFLFYDVYFDYNQRNLPFHPRVHIYDTHNIDLKENVPGLGSAEELLRRAWISKKRVISDINQYNQEEKSSKDDDDSVDERTYVSQTFEMLLDRMQIRTVETLDQNAEVSASSDIVEILNPAPPYTNSVYNLTMSSVRSMHTEIRRAVQLLYADSPTQKNWGSLLQPIDFLQISTHFVIVEMKCPRRNMQRTAKTFESQLKHFLYHLESAEPDCKFRLLPKNIESLVTDCKKTFSSIFPDNEENATRELGGGQERFSHFRYAISINDERNSSEILDLETSSNFLRYAFERNNENSISFRAKCFSRESVLSFYGL